jgi:cytochrome c
MIVPPLRVEFGSGDMLGAAGATFCQAADITQGMKQRSSMNHHTRLLIAVLTIAWAATTAYATTNPAASGNDGQVKFNNHCRTCHSVKPNDNRMGPSLHNIFGAKAGAAAEYPNYSQGLKTSGIVWDEETLDQFIADPDSVIPTNNMKPYKGVTDKAVRASIVAYLKSSSERG